MGETLLNYALQLNNYYTNYLETVKVLIHKGADVNVISKVQFLLQNHLTFFRLSNNMCNSVTKLHCKLLWNDVW